MTSAVDRERLARALLRSLHRSLPDGLPIDLRLAAEGDDESRPDDGRARIALRGPDALSRLLWPPTPTSLAEAYLRGDLDIEGDIDAAIRAGEAFDLGRLGWADRRRLLRGVLRLRAGAAPAPELHRVAHLHGVRHSPARDLAAVRFHYDVGNDFFALWLDRRLVYSCAYFDDADAAHPEAALDAAQEAKLDLICRKLRLAPGQRMLDIGCGWGGLVVFVAERYGVEAVGITLSEPQAAYARTAAERAGVAERVRVEVRDYRDLAPLGTFDAVASVGMVEHVGRGQLHRYFEAAYGALRPGGLFLNHGIATTETRRRPALQFRPRGGDFVGRYVFPDGELTPVHETLARARGAGFEALHVQSLRPHYALTLAAWVGRLEGHAPDARRLVGEEVYRTWRLYMAAFRRGFEQGSLDVAQLLLARPSDRLPAERPLRPWW
ncbi:MAG: class I SAM-dependent methyltransferase [Candidatus Limnocylindrales bacterium]